MCRLAKHNICVGPRAGKGEPVFVSQVLQDCSSQAGLRCLGCCKCHVVSLAACALDESCVLPMVRNAVL